MGAGGSKAKDEEEDAKDERPNPGALSARAVCGVC